MDAFEALEWWLREGEEWNEMSELGKMKVILLVSLDASFSGTYSERQNILVAAEEARSEQSAPSLNGLKDKKAAMEQVTWVTGAETETIYGGLGGYIFFFP